MLPGDTRLHLQHGPIDLIIGAAGPGQQEAFCRAARRFETVLDKLVKELPVLRRHNVGGAPVLGRVARRMVQAVEPLSEDFITPMAAVAGAVADEILATLAETGDIASAYVNNGGDIAFHLTPGQQFTAAVASTPAAQVVLTEDLPSRGIATSGWRGRSLSRGIADSVTVLAGTAASADATATMIANAVDLPGHSGITRARARDLAPDSDLGARTVTTGVPVLTVPERSVALEHGLARAREYLARGLIHAAFVTLQGESRSVAIPSLLTTIRETENARLHASQDHAPCRGDSP